VTAEGDVQAKTVEHCGRSSPSSGFMVPINTNAPNAGARCRRARPG
jgi:hypothetical protein